MKPQLALFAAMLAVNAWAGPLPEKLSRSVRPLDVRSADLSGGVLRLVSYRNDINLEQFEFAVTNAVCAPWLMDNKKGWGGYVIDRIELSNSGGDETYSIGNARQVCRDIGGIAGGAEPVKRYLKSRGQVCEAGKCGTISH